MGYKLSLPKAKQLVLEAVEAHPNRRNPTTGNNSSCIYDDGKNHRCIVGEVLYLAGLRVPEARAGSIRGLYQRRSHYHTAMSERTANWLGRIQGSFDGLRESDGRPFTWRKALNVAKDRGYFNDS